MVRPDEAPPEVGEHWGYRARSADALDEVEVVRYGTKKPLRVLVRFSALEQEGRKDWVPPARLKVPWAEREGFTEREQRWAAVRAESNLPDTPTGAAIDIFFANLPASWTDRQLVEEGYNDETGILKISDVDGLVMELDLDRIEVAEHPLAFIDNGRLIVPWSVSEKIVRRLAERFADRILPAVAAEERAAAQHARWGRTIGRDTYIPAEICAETDAEYQQARDIVRGWCGQAAGERHDELMALREEVVRLGLLVESAVTALRVAGAAKAADRIARELGVPIEVVQANRQQQA